MRILLFLCFLSLVAPLTAEHSHAQENRLLLVEDAAYPYIIRLQRMGYLLDLPPTALPYTFRDVHTSLQQLDTTTLPPHAAHWAMALTQYVTPEPVDEQEILFGVSLSAGLEAANTKRLDLQRPYKSDVFLFPNASLQFYIEKKDWIAHLGLRHDVWYDRDPDGLDAAKRLYVRSEDGYLGYQGRWARVYLGRFSNHWGLFDGASTVFSANPRSIDQVNFRVGGSRFSLQSILGELDNLSADSLFTGRAFESGSIRRFIAAHRLDWRPSKRFNLSIMEATLYSGVGASASIKFLNPLYGHAFETDNSPKNDENNGMVAGLIWAYLHPVTLHGQLLIDDIDLSGKGDEPPSLALTGNLALAGVGPALDLGLDIEAISSRSYNAIQRDGQFVYLNRGIATAFSDYFMASLYADWYPSAISKALIISPRITVLLQGERDIHEQITFRGDQVDFILDGTVAKTVYAGARVFLRFGPWGWLRFETGYNHTTNAQHISGDTSQRLLYRMGFHFRIFDDHPFSIATR